MDTPKSRGNESGREGSKQLAAVSTSGKRPSKAARTGASSYTRCLEDILVSRCGVVWDEETDVGHLVCAREIKEGVVHPFVWGTLM